MTGTTRSKGGAQKLAEMGAAVALVSALDGGSLPSVLHDEDEGIAEALRRDALQAREAR